MPRWQCRGGRRVREGTPLISEGDSPPDTNTRTHTYTLLRLYRAPPDPWETETEWETTPSVHSSV